MSTDPFYDYYAAESASSTTAQRFAATKQAVVRAAIHFGVAGPQWRVADIGCGAGTQSVMWARDGHQVCGLDINESLIALGRDRAAKAGLRIDFKSGSAASLPWASDSIDICLCPELLEHVSNWQACLDEAVRVLRPGGVLYLSTTNKLCPLQDEFQLTGYSWYPAILKRRYERLAVTTRPELVNHAQYPAVNWFSFYGLRSQLGMRGLRSLDRFDIAALADGHSQAARAALGLIRSNGLLRWLGQVATPYTVVFAQKQLA